MIDEKKWILADVHLQAMRKSIPTYVDRDMVAEYHAIVTGFEQASGQDFSTFRISDSKFAPRITSIQIGSLRRAARTEYSSETYCRGEYFKRQVEALAQYVPHFHSAASTADWRDYETMSDEQLEALASRYHIGSYGHAHGGIDRQAIIKTLRERDKSINSSSVQPAIHIGTVTGSIIQQAPSHSPATIHYQAADVGSVLEQIKAQLSNLPLSSESKSEIDIDIKTVELQLSAQRPKGIVIHESLRSVRAILEGIAGSLIATEIVHKITQIIGQ